MGRWKDQDGYWVDEDRDLEAEDHERRLKRSRQCVCDPGHKMPGTCPGRDSCPYSGDEKEQEDD